MNLFNREEKMKKKIFITLIIIWWFSQFGSVAALNGYIISPMTEVPLEGGHDFNEVSFWELTPRMMLIDLLLFASPLLFYPAEILYSFKLVTFLSYRYIVRKNVLNHDSRRKLYECIVQNPGIHFGALIQSTKITRGPVHYHLDTLKKVGAIVAVRQGNRIGYFN